MLKRFYSKRSGFTLVEIIVAFAVFAIMASMIAQILQLSINARNSNNIYAMELARQERILTVIEKADYVEANKTGQYKFDFTDGSTFSMDYEIKATDPTADQGEGINYFVSPVDYDAAGVGDNVGGDPSGAGGAGQTAKYDTRITGTMGIYSIEIRKVQKDTNTYPEKIKYKPNSWSPEVEIENPLYIKPGNSRYWIEVAANNQDDSGNITLSIEEDRYAQYRLMFFLKELDDVKSKDEYTDSDGKTYTKDVYKEAKILNYGLISQDFASVQAAGGLSSSNTTDPLKGTNINNNAYTVQKVGNNSVRIGTPVERGPGVRLQGHKFTRFYVDFEGDPQLTVEDFGNNCELDAEGHGIYKALPVYDDAKKSDFNSDGTPKYNTSTSKVNAAIYGGYLHTRHYGTTPAPEG